MKKNILLALILVFTLCGCVFINQTKDPTSDEQFEIVEKVDIEISDYIPEDDVPVTDITALEKLPEDVEHPPIESVVDTPGVEKGSSDKAPESVPADKPSQEPPMSDNTQAPSPVTLSGKVICIDAAHGAFTESVTENIAPNSDITKEGYSLATKGAKYSEDEITLLVALKLKPLLEEKGATVLMTRTDETVTMSNKEKRYMLMKITLILL